MSQLTALARGAITPLACIALLAAPALAQEKHHHHHKDRPAAIMAPPVNVAQAAVDLAGGNVDAGTRAAAVLGRDRSPAGLEALLDALALGLHPQVAAAALDAIAQRPGPSALDTLYHYLVHRDPKVRASAVTALAAIDDRRAEKHLLASLRDGHEAVRAAAAAGVLRRKIKEGTPVLLKLLVKGDAAAAPALAGLADPELAKSVAETIGTAPDAAVARCLGQILARPDFKPESARVEVVRALGRVPGNEALEQLTSYVAAIPPNPPRPSRKEAEALIEKRMGGDQ